ncbi:MAG: tetrathionate reductase family octaheme c-type cytochrome [Burkholderiaceae bacterium]|jgi:octaheme c-type cytochrome (tetrathionate reductase family)|nr:tetrathionate reductase family octaheme c-type cytochrome [Burkholderiaceae bacterium]
MIRTIAAAIFAALLAAAGSATAQTVQAASAAAQTVQAASVTARAEKVKSTTDHSKLKELQRDFKSGPEVTAACLSCHTEAAHQVMRTTHWKWEFNNPATHQVLGKRYELNSFCGNAPSNGGHCTSCHISYGWQDASLPPPTDPNAVDCLICHERTGLYSKESCTPAAPSSAGNADQQAEEAKRVEQARKMAQSVALPGRDNCGKCHFFGGGDDNVKHGDLSSALDSPARDVDIHMSPDGENFSCESCHVTRGHAVAGSRYTITAKDTGGASKPWERRDAATCESCHSGKPHKGLPVGAKLNDHASRVACQTCHIPSFARGGVATKTFWDWSTAGQLKDGQPFTVGGFTQSNGKERDTYMSIKGTMKWAENVVPYYQWFNGKVEYTMGQMTIDPAKRVEINHLEGSPDDGISRIWPFKRMEGRQAYDTELKRLVYNQVYGPETDTAFWTNFNWDKSIQASMDYLKLPYSGKHGFVDTYMYWPITHMVAPKEQVLDCQDCHARGGRLAGIEGVYMPGSKRPIGGLIGLIVLVLVALTTAGHAALRLFGKKGAHHG